MKFKISKSKLYSCLSIVSKAVSSYSPLPALTGIKIDVNSSSIYFTGSDSNVSIQTLLSNKEDTTLEINETGSILLESSYILEIVRKIDGDFVTIESFDGSLVYITSKDSKFKLNVIKPSEYPPIDFNINGSSFEISTSELREIISQTVFAVSKKESRAILTGVNLCIKDNEIAFTATDSYRLAKKTIDINEDITMNVTLPEKSLTEVNKLLDNYENVKIVVNDRKAQFVLNETIIQTRLIEGVYPDTNRLIPSAFEYELIIDKYDILNSIDRACLIKNDGISVIKLDLSEIRNVLSSKSMEIGSVEEVLTTATYKGENLKISFNGKYVYDAIRTLKGPLVRFSLCGEMKAFIIEGVDDSSILQLILPVRTYD